MPNWVADWLAAHPEAESRIVKRARHALHVRRDDGLIDAHFTAAPCHWWDGVDWRALDTSIVNLGGGYWGAGGLIARINQTTKAVEIVGTGYSQRTTRVGVLRPSTMALRGTPVAVPVGTVQGDSLVASGVVGGAAWTHRLRLTERGVEETLTLAARPTLSNVVGTDYLILETAISGASFPQGELLEYDQGDVHFPLPRASDAAGSEAPCKRYARVVSGTQYVYTGIPVSWLATAAYPIVIDPDFTAGSADCRIWGQAVFGYYEDAWATSTGTDAELWVGQAAAGYYYVDMVYLPFDTSSIGTSNTVGQATLTLTLQTDVSTVDFDVYIVKLGVSNAVRETCYDARLSADLDDHIWRNTSGASLNTPYTSGTLSTSYVNRTGTTYYALVSSRDRNHVGAPSGNNESARIYDSATATTSYRPVLNITYAAATSYIQGIMRHHFIPSLLNARIGG